MPKKKEPTEEQIREVEKKVKKYVFHVLSVHGIKAADVGVGILTSPDVPPKYFSIMGRLADGIAAVMLGQDLPKWVREEKPKAKRRKAG